MSFKPHLSQKLYRLTTQLFRCGGLAPSPEQHDRVGWHDAAFWLVVAAIGAAWYFMLFQPQRQRNGMLGAREQVLQTQVRAERAELDRLRRELALLKSGAKTSWEMAARAKLGWLEPGEVLDLEAWRKRRIAAGKGDPFAQAPKRLPAPPGPFAQATPRPLPSAVPPTRNPPTVSTTYPRQQAYVNYRQR